MAITAVSSHCSIRTARGAASARDRHKLRNERCRSLPAWVRYRCRVPWSRSFCLPWLQPCLWPCPSPYCRVAWRCRRMRLGRMPGGSASCQWGMRPLVRPRC